MEESLTDAPLARADVGAWRQAVAIVIAATAVRLALAAVIPLFPDETYYWDWSRHLAPGYFDHPPVIAMLIAAGVRLSPTAGGAFFVRLFPVLAGGVASFATAALARRVAGGTAARMSAIIFALMPLAATGLVLATPDAPLLGAIAVGLYGVVRALQSPVRSTASLGWWSVAGIALGLAFASKYTSILLPVTLTAAVLMRPSLRARLREPGPYVACVLATLVFLPVLRWNAAHDWISFRFQLQHGLGTPPTGSAIKRELDLIGGQLGLVSPIVFLLMTHAVWRTVRRPADDVRFALAVIATGSWAFFLYSAMRRAVEANWPAPSYIAGVVLLVALPSWPARDRWLRGGVALAGLLVAIIYLHALHPMLPLPARRDPLARSAGWPEVAARVRAARDSVGRAAAGVTSWAGADRYQDVSELAYHARRDPADATRDVVFCICLGGRRSQYDLWPSFPERAKAGDALVLLLDETAPRQVHGTAEALAPYFTTLRRGAVAPLLRGTDTVSVRRIWILGGYRGGWPAAAASTRAR